MKLIAGALVKAQAKIKNAVLDSKNPHFHNQYASLESVLAAVKPAANEHGIAVVQTCGKDAEGHYVETVLLHDSGELVTSRVYLVLSKNDMQGLGSAITYGRRYSLAAMFGIGQDDDDGEATTSQTNSNQSVFTNEKAKGAKNGTAAKEL